MNLVQYIKIILKYPRWVILTPLCCAAAVFFLTKNAKKQYASSTTLYTGVASGYSITSTEDERLDYFAVNNAFDNLVASAKSRETIEQVALHLLAEHLLVTKPDSQVLGPEGFNALHKLVDEPLLQKARSLKTADNVYNYISTIYASKADNVIARILSQPSTFYNIDDLKTGIVVTRINTSDVLEVDYTSSDPAVCQRVLELHTIIFTANYNHLKSDQTASAVGYFEAKLAGARDTLQASEDNLKKFGQENRIINYYEQTRYIAQSKEEVEKEIYAQRIIEDGCKNALALIEKKLSSREKQLINSATIMTLREHLSDVNTQAERAGLFQDAEKVSEFKATEKQLEDSIKTASNQYMALNYSAETVPRTSLVQEWVENAIAFDKAKAGLSVLQNQKQNYLGEFDQFAPLGSSLKRLDRQVDINEQEFLSILHGLNLARLRQSNLSLNANVVIQDKPYFPLKPEKSIRMLLVIVSLLASFVVVISVIIGRQLMDASLRTPDRTQKIIGLPIAGIMLAQSPGSEPPYRGALRNFLGESFINILLPYISLKNGRIAGKISLVSFDESVYQPRDIKLLNGLLTGITESVCWLVPDHYATLFSQALAPEVVHVYKAGIGGLNARTPGEIAGAALPDHDLLIYVSPCILRHSIPAAMIRLASLNLVVAGAGDTWRNADKESLAKIEKMAPDAPIYTLLVNADEANLDDTVGEIPKKRSWLRKKVKKLITRNLK
jgi:succinoglycan biosynthesis transport protein ExoP